MRGRWSSLRDARRYVRWAEEDHPLSVGAGVFAVGDLPPLAHAVEVWTHARSPYYRVTFFGGLHVTGPLTTAWDGPRFSIAHGLDPTRPSVRAERQTSSDGPPLSVYHADLKKQAFEKFQEWFLARTLELSQRVSRPPWSPPAEPDLAQLRPLVEAEFAKLLKRRRQPKPKKR